MAAGSCLALFAQTESAPTQPIPFSHKAHVARGLECKDCHTNADPGEDMGLPQAAKCMACHGTIAKPIPWVRVYSLPAEIYWSHRPHLTAGMTCTTCHGRVSDMDVVARVTNVTTMQGCVDCHKEHKVSTGCNFCHEDK